MCDISKLAKLIVLCSKFNLDAPSVYHMMYVRDEFMKKRLFQRPFV